MLRIPRLVLFKMVNENFSFFIFSHLSFSWLKKKKKENPLKEEPLVGHSKAYFSYHLLGT